MNKKYAWLLFNLWRIIPSYILYRFSKNKKIVTRDLGRWMNFDGIENLSECMRFCWVMLYYDEFRNVFYYRMWENNPILTGFARLFLKPMSTLYLNTKNIGPGLFIQHGFATIVTAESIGEDCWINQQVTIGYTNETDFPTICNRVKINAGAKVLGAVTLGDDCIVGANAVVVKSVPPNCTVVGVPARIIRRNGVRVDESL